MRIVGTPRSFYVAAQHRAVELSPKAWERLRWLKAWRALRERGLTAQQAAETLHLPRSSLYRWEGRLKANGAPGLEEGSRRPKRLRRPQWSPELAQAVLRVREEYPAWGKEVLQVLVAREGWADLCVDGGADPVPAESSGRPGGAAPSAGVGTPASSAAGVRRAPAQELCRGGARRRGASLHARRAAAAGGGLQAFHRP